MTLPDFRALARARAGAAAWDGLPDDDRARLVRAEKRAHLAAAVRVQAPAPRDWAAWLRAQPPAVQDQALGPARAAQLRAGALAITRYTDPPGVLTLEQLAKAWSDDNPDE